MSDLTHEIIYMKSKISVVYLIYYSIKIDLTQF